MKLVTIGPPFVQGNMCSAYKRQSIVIDVTIQRRQRLVYLGYSSRKQVSRQAQFKVYDILLLFCAMSSICETSRTSVGEAIECFSNIRQCLIEFSSRRTIGRPVPRLILRCWSEGIVGRSHQDDLLMVEPVET